MSDSAAILEVPTFGRSFQLGMLYDATTDKLIQGNQLWDKNTLQRAQQDRPYLDTQFSAIQDDSLATRCLLLGADNPSLKINLLAGLTRVSGASKFFTDHQSPREVSRVTVQFKYSSHIHELDVQQLGQIQNQDIVQATRATHFVSKVLFGLEVFLVIDRPMSAEEDISVIREKLGNSAEFLTKMYESGKSDLAQLDQCETAKYKFKVYSDFSLPKSTPSTFIDVIAFLEQHLFKQFKQGSSNLVPQKVWLYPLCNLDSSAPSIVQEIKEEFVGQVERITEKLKHAEVGISNLNKTNVQACSTIPCFQEQQTRLMGLIKRFQTDMTKQLFEAISNIRNGSSDSNELDTFLKQIESSPFGSSSITSLLESVQLEIRTVSQFLNGLSSESVRFITSDEIDALAIDFDSILSFEFRLGGNSNACLNKMEEYLRTKMQNKHFEEASTQVTPWYNSGSNKKRAIQVQAKLFKDFVLANTERDDIAFVIHFNSDIPLPSKEGAAVVLYADCDEPTEFDLPSKPLELCITKDTGKEVELTWNKPKYGQSSVISYTVTFKSIDSTPEDMRTVKTEGASELITVQDLVPEYEYEFVVQAGCSAGLSPKSKAVTRKPSNKLPTESQPGLKSKTETVARIKPYEQPPTKPPPSPICEITARPITKEPPPVAPKTPRKPPPPVAARKDKDRTSPMTPVRNEQQHTMDKKFPFCTQTGLINGAATDNSSGPIVLTLPPRSRISPQLLQRFEKPFGIKLPSKSGVSQRPCTIIEQESSPPPKDQIQDPALPLPSKDETQHSAPLFPPKYQTQDSTLSLPPKDQTQDSTLSHPLKEQTQDSTLPLPPKDQTQDSTLSHPPKDQTQDSTLSLPAKDQTQNPDLPLPPRDQIQDPAPPPLPPKDQTRDLAPPLPPKEQTQEQIQTSPLVSTVTSPIASQSLICDSDLSNSTPLSSKNPSKTETQIESQTSIPSQSNSELNTGKTSKKFKTPKVKNVTHESIELKWKKPSSRSGTVQYYSVFYQRSDESDIVKEKKTQGAEQHITIDSLSSETSYSFRVQATFSSGKTKKSKRIGKITTRIYLPETIRSKSKLISRKDQKPAIYELTKTQTMINDENRVAKYEVGQPFIGGSCKVLIVVGATGAGKTTLINGIANYMYGVQWEDDFRFVLVANEPERKSQAHSQTSWITAYTLHRGEGSPIPYSLTIIDTPGFGDTEGIERDKKIADQIKNFFSVRPPKGIDILHGIGFVAQASLARLSPSQKYIFDSILSMYGRDVASNIFMMTTFADGHVPPVMEAIKVAKIPYQECFKFNNSALFSTGEEDSFDDMLWKMGVKSFGDFFKQFGKAEHRSLQLTREVLNEREQLENVLKELQSQIHAGLTKMDELQRVVILLEHNKFLIEQNKDFIIKVPVTKQRKVDIASGRYTTNCLNCNYTCHNNCIYSNNDDKKRCCAMNKKGDCIVCPKKCGWQKHVNNPYIFELYEEEEIRTSAELKDRYDTAVEGESRAETMIANVEKELYSLEVLVLEKADKARRSLMRLDEIALKPNPLSEVDYIDQLIVSEEQHAQMGWQDRVAVYKSLRKRAALMRKIKDKDWIRDASLFSYLGEDEHSRAAASLNQTSCDFN